VQKAVNVSCMWCNKNTLYFDAVFFMTYQTIL